MNKIIFLGAGSTVFSKNLLGDCMQTDTLRGMVRNIIPLSKRWLKKGRSANRIPGTSGAD